MDHSLYGYLNRRSKEELEDIITMYQSLQENEYYQNILDLATHCLEERIAQENA